MNQVRSGVYFTFMVAAFGSGWRAKTKRWIAHFPRFDRGTWLVSAFSIPVDGLNGF
jgi:hypothetical protein